jgi:hypothetical protein
MLVHPAFHRAQEGTHKKHYHCTPAVLQHLALNSTHTDMDRRSRYPRWCKILSFRFACRQKQILYYRHIDKQLGTPWGQVVHLS